MLILLIGRLSLASRKKLILVMVLDVLMMVTGFFSSYSFNIVFILFWAVLSFVFFFMVLYGVHHFIQLAISHYPSKERSFNGLFAVTVTCWSGANPGSQAHACIACLVCIHSAVFSHSDPHAPFSVPDHLAAGRL
jgi:bacteriorhodopsin